MNPVEQLTKIISDQKEELREVREMRRQTLRNLTEYDEKEVEILIGIERSKNLLEQLTGEESE